MENLVPHRDSIPELSRPYQIAVLTTLCRPTLLKILKQFIVQATDRIFPSLFLCACLDVEGGIALSNDVAFANCPTSSFLELVQDTELCFLVQYFDVRSREIRFILIQSSFL